MKQYRVSNLPDSSIINVADFFADPFFFYQAHGYLPENASARYPRQTDTDFLIDSEYLFQKLDQYCASLSKSLNEIHHLKYPDSFWQKVLGLGFQRMVMLCYDFYSFHKKEFNPDEFQFIKLSNDDFYFPQDFEDQRSFLQNYHFSQEQMFSIFVESFYSGQGKFFRSQFEKQRPAVSSETRFGIVTRIKNLTWKKIFLKILKIRKIEGGILHSYFDLSKMNELIVKSKGLIRPLGPIDFISSNSKIDIEKRLKIVKSIEIKDDFDLYFSKLIYSLMPMLIIENFQSALVQVQQELDKNKRLKFIVSEGWLSGSLDCLYLAVAKLKGIDHFYNQHNCITHQYIGHNTRYISKIVDKFFTLGWNDDNKKIIKSSSLYQFRVHRDKNSYGILYISGLAAGVREDICCHYPNGDTAVYYMEFKSHFFKSLDDATLKLIFYKGYPVIKSGYYFVYHDKDFIGKYIPKFKAYTDAPMNAKNLMASAALIIVDYLSTAYLEALVSNIPTVIFRDPKVYRLLDSTFYRELEEAKIMFTDPVLAANHVKEISSDPTNWWQSELCQKARIHFLSKNIDTSDKLICDLLKEL